ncbi:serine hydrolase [Streptomyces lydicus]|uniref:serine hydrolase n=1 Tax=Streptomyces lydicus TaxID=47763 RepID=UPI0037F8C832
MPDHLLIPGRLGAELARADADIQLHAVDLDTGGDVAVAADQQVVIASVAKILIVLEFARQAASGQLDPGAHLTIRSEDRLGGWGIAGCADDVEISLRDCAYFAMSLSDNTAADAIVRRVGGDAVGMLVAELGLDRTRFLGGPRHLLRSMYADLGARDDREFAARYRALSPTERRRSLSVFDPRRTTSSTARDMTRLLGLIWHDRAGPADACAAVRRLMTRQLSSTRLASGFPPPVTVAAKSGTLPGVHMEAGVVRYPDGHRYALAVFATARDLHARPADLDETIGRVAHAAVQTIREGPGDAGLSTS